MEPMKPQLQVWQPSSLRAQLAFASWQPAHLPPQVFECEGAVSVQVHACAVATRQASCVCERDACFPHILQGTAAVQHLQGKHPDKGHKRAFEHPDKGHKRASEHPDKGHKRASEHPDKGHKRASKHRKLNKAILHACMPYRGCADASQQPALLITRAATLLVHGRNSGRSRSSIGIAMLAGLNAAFPVHVSV